MLRPEPVPTNIAPSQPYAGLGNKLSLGGTIPLSTSILGIILAVVVVSWIIVWAMAYRVGFGRADEQAARELSLAAAPVTDPLVSEREPRPPSAIPTPTAGREPRIQTPPPVTERSSPPVRAGVRAVMVPPERDPRLPDLNYYAIEGQLDRETAEDIVLFLASHGVESVAVDTSPPGTNNPRSYRVYGLKGFSSAEYRTPARAEYEQLISRLGEAYKRDRRGTTDLSRTYWERYRP